MKSVYRVAIGALVLAVLGTSVASAEGLVECKATGRVVMITMGTATYNNQKLNCITSDFIDSLTPCAPVGGFTLSTPDGKPPIVKVVTKREDFGQFSGGVVEHELSDARIYFEGGFNSPADGYKKAWSFEVNRVSGRGTLTMAVSDNGPMQLACTGAGDAQ